MGWRGLDAYSRLGAYQSAFRMGAYSRRALILIWGWALIRINTVTKAGNMHINSICLTEKHPNRTM